MSFDWVQPILTFAGVIIGSGLIQFLITRKDNKKDKIDKLYEKIDKQNIIVQERYDNLKKDVKQTLDNYGKMNKERDVKYHESIDKLSEAICQLTKNDTEQSKYIKYMGEELMGLAHDRLVNLTDVYQERGFITLKEKATLEAIFKPYHEGLGGNGDGEQGYKFAMSLPIVTESKAKELDNKNKNINNVAAAADDLK